MHGCGMEGRGGRRERLARVWGQEHANLPQGRRQQRPLRRCCSRRSSPGPRSQGAAGSRATGAVHSCQRRRCMGCRSRTSGMHQPRGEGRRCQRQEPLPPPMLPPLAPPAPLLRPSGDRTGWHRRHPRRSQAQRRVALSRRRKKQCGHAVRIQGAPRLLPTRDGARASLRVQAQARRHRRAAQYPRAGLEGAAAHD